MHSQTIDEGDNETHQSSRKTYNLPKRKVVTKLRRRNASVPDSGDELRNNTIQHKSQQDHKFRGSLATESGASIDFTEQVGDSMPQFDIEALRQARNSVSKQLQGADEQPLCIEAFLNSTMPTRQKVALKTVKLEKSQYRSFSKKDEPVELSDK